MTQRVLTAAKLGMAAALLSAALAGCKHERVAETTTAPPETMTVREPVYNEPAPAVPVARERRGLLDPQQFVDEAASFGIFEIQSAQLDVQRSPDPAQVNLARDILRDHDKLNDELRDLATRKGLKFPDTMLPKQRIMLGRLRDTRDADFARFFLDQQLRSHDDAISLFEDAARDLTDPDLRSFAERTLPTLREHRQHLAH